MNSIFRLLPLALIVLIPFGCSKAIGASVQAQANSLEFDGLTRDYLLYVPESLQQPAPLVIALHGGGGTAAQFRAETDFDSVADQNSFIVVYPQGVNREWNERRGSGMTVRRSDADDVGFIDALIDHLAGQYAIDQSRIYAMGISNGGFMSLRLACDLSERLAGIGVVAAELTVDMANECNPTREMRVAIINGTDDPIIPYDGGEVRVSGAYRGDVAGTDFIVNNWLDWNGCNPSLFDQTVLDNRPLDETSIEITDWQDCVPFSAVRLYRVVGGGHTLPGGTQYLPRTVVGNVSRELHAPTELWIFWSGG